MLEVIDKGSCTEAHPMPLLFVHGGWHGAWCWDEYFLDFFAAKGYRVLAVSQSSWARSQPNLQTVVPVFDRRLRRRCRRSRRQTAHRSSGDRPLDGRLRGAEVLGVTRRASRRTARIHRGARNPRTDTAIDAPVPVAHDALRVDGQDVEKHEHPWASTPDVLLFARSRAAGCHICSAIAGRECTGHLPGHAVLRFAQAGERQSSGPGSGRTA